MEGPCVHEDGDNERAYRRVEEQAWDRDGCECRKRAPKVFRELCGCRKGVWFQNSCADAKKGILNVNRVQERLTFSGPKNSTPSCRVEVQKFSKKIGELESHRACATPPRFLQHYTCSPRFQNAHLQRFATLPARMANSKSRSRWWPSGTASASVEASRST